jgi:isoamylase
VVTRERDEARESAGAQLLEIWPGQPYPLGATYDGFGVNSAVFSEVADKVELCLFDDERREGRIALPEVTAFCWHAYAPQLQPGQRYGFREAVDPHDPRRLLVAPASAAS